MTSRILAGLAATLVLALAACMPPPPPEPPKPTVVNLTISGASDMNATASGKGTPAKIQVLYLASDAKFNITDFFALNESASGALGPDLLGVDEYFLQPGQQIEDVKSFDQPVAKIGVVAAFRNVDGPGWRASTALIPNAVNATQVGVASTAVTVSVAPGS